MHPALLPLLRSPEGLLLHLTPTREQNGEIVSGRLDDERGGSYPIEDGIPRLLPSALLDAQRQEIAARDAQVEAYDRMAFLNLFGRVEIPLTRRALGVRPTDCLLEAGCGTGRMTRLFAGQVRELVAIDFSFESLRVNRRKLLAAGLGRVHLVQADLCHLPFASGVFDRVMSCQVLEHVPGEAGRLAAVAELARVCGPQGTLALSAYQHSLLTRLFGRKEGAHDGGIPFFRFTRRELHDLLSTHFSVETMTGALVYLYLTRCRPRRPL